MMLRFVRRVVVIGWLGAAALSFSGHALAQGEADGTADDRAQSFRAVNGGVKEDIPGGPLMLAAYAVVWLVVFGYVFRLVRMHRGVEASLARLERAVGEGALQAHAGGSATQQGSPAQHDATAR
jgi:CcmD family protein